MYKSKAIIVALIIAAIGAYVVVATTSVLSPSVDAYKGVSSAPPASAKQVEPATMATDSNPAEAQPQTQAEPEMVEPIPAAVAETPVTPAVEPAPATEVATATEVEPTGKVHIVTAEGLKYAPLVITIQPGDTVAWENMSSHDTQSLEGLIPEGAEMWHSQVSENYQRTFFQQGIYVYKCTPHFGAGMGGVIIVGEPVNLAAIKAVEVKGAAKRLVKKGLQVAEKM
jgi:pseudoazurin